MKSAVFFAAVFACSISTVLGSERIVTKLDNGLTVALEEMHDAPVAALRLYVRAGSITEGEYLGTGISHYFEHLLAGGTTTRRTEEEARKLAASIGGQINAYTTTDHTCFYIQTLARHFDTALELLSDWVTRHKFTETEFLRERDVILEEMRGGESNPFRQVYRLMQGTMFQRHPAGLPVIGERELFLRLQQEDLRAYYERMFVPANMVFVATGAFDATEALGKVRASFADLEARPAPAIALPAEPRQLARREAVHEMDVGMAYFVMAFRTVTLCHPDLYPLDVLSNILSRGDSSRLVRSVREEKKLAFSIHSWSYTPPYDAGTFGIRALCPPEAVSAVEEAVFEELRRIREEGVTEAELDKARKQVIAERYFGRQTAAERASDLGISILSAHDPDFTETYVAQMQKVTAEDVQRVARHYFRPSAATAAIVRPKAEEEAKEVERERPAPPETQRFVLDNGIRLLVRENPALPIVAMRAVFLGGVRAETPENNGIGRLVAHTMTRGTANRTVVEIATALDAMGAELSAESGNNTLYAEAESLAEDLDSTMEIMADVLLRPSFPEDELAQVQRLTVAGIQQRHDNWRNLLSDTFRQEFYQSSPYRMRPEGTEESVMRLGREDLLEYHRRNIVAENMVLAVFGDVKAEKVKEMVERHFADMRRAPDYAPPAPPAEPPLQDSREVVKRIQRQDMGTVFVGYTGLSMDQERERRVLDVIDAITSGVSLPGGWLHETLRGKEDGLVYEVHAYSMPGLEPGFFGAYAATSTEKAEEVARLIQEQIARTLTEDFDPEELATAKETCIAAHAMADQTSGQQAMRQALDELYGLGHDASDGYAEGIRSVTPEEMRDVARRHLQHRLTLIVLPPEEGN